MENNTQTPAADVRAGKTGLLLQGTKYNLCYDLNAFAELEDTFGSVEKALGAMEQGSFKAVRTFVWAGLLRDNISITEREVGAMINMDNLEHVAEQIGNAIALSTPKTNVKQHPAAKRGNNNRRK